MSKIGKVPIIVPKEVKVAIQPTAVSCEGPKGKISLVIPHGITVAQQDGKLIVTRGSDTKQSRANHGTIRARLANMIEGVTKGHKKDLEIQGIGLRAQSDGKKITFNLGFSHQVEFPIPADVAIAVANQTALSISGVDNVRVGQVASSIRKLKRVEPYKGKGIRYVGENVRRKQGKSVTK